MTAATFEDATTLQGAPRPSVEDAWVALNRRYAIGAAVLAAALLLLWVLGMGPGASDPDVPGASTTQRAADVPSAASRPSAAAPAGAPGAASGSAATPAAPATSSAAGTPAASAASAASSATPAGASASAGTAGPARAASGGSEASASGSGAGGSAATPRAVPGAPVARLYFEPDQAWPSGEVGPRLAPVLARLKAEPDTKALVSGFHDRRGSVELNAALSRRRAETVRRVLIREGVAADRIVLAKPQQTTGSGADREARRVEVTVAR